MPHQPGRHIELREFQTQILEFANGPVALIGCQDLRHTVSHLRREQAEPYFSDLGPVRPKFEEFLKVSGTVHHLTGNRTVNGDVLTLYVLQDPVVGGGRAPLIMVWL
ncbi:MAG TPA: hypothetical protein VFQ91_22160 [Bryobacteraceae bacterium]|nr:hypothetical protein [Bryobacteraceae bacterium]